MNQKDYVNLEVAKLLKEKGFNEPYLYFYHNGSLYMLSGDIIYCEDDSINDGIVYPVPSLYEAQKWLRNNYGLCVISIPFLADMPDSMPFTFNIYKKIHNKFSDEICDDYQYLTYEEALNEGIKEALKLI